MSEEKIPLYFKWVSLAPDPRQWKPGGPPILEPMDTFIRVEVDKQFAEEKTLDDAHVITVLSLEGFMNVIKQFENVMKPEETIHNPNFEQDENEEELKWEDEDYLGSTWNT